MDVSSCFVFSRNVRPFLASVVFLTLLDALLTACGRRGSIVFILCLLMLQEEHT